MIGVGPIPQKAPRQACDSCRRRKTKCNRAQPCEKCIEAFLSCTYNSLPKRKGPKGRTAPVLSSLPRATDRYPELSPASASAPTDTLPGWTAARDPAIPLPTAPLYTQFESQSDNHDPLSSASPNSSFNSPSGNSAFFPPDVRSVPQQCMRIPSQVLLDHVNIFVQNLYSIMPVFDPNRVRDDCINPETLSPQRYAFLAALSAATHVQLKLDNMDQHSMGLLKGIGNPGPHSNPISTEYFLSEALQARAQFDVIEQQDTDNLLTSFFLFATYGNLNKQTQAWFYLSQAISLAISLNMHLEATYSGMDPDESEEWRRIFWLLFVTERAYALQQKKPITLQNSIRKPEVFHSRNPALTYGFLALIDLFEKLTSDFYRILCAENYEATDKTKAIATTYRNLCDSVPLLNEVSETQKVDILITQGWLQVWLWKLAMADLQRHSSEAVIPPNSPALVGKSFMNIFVSVSQSSMDAHGIGMEQKLFDVGTSVADLMTIIPPRANQHLTTMVIDPKELLWGILVSLSKSRGAESYLFPLLMDKSKDVLGLMDSSPHGDLNLSTTSAQMGQDVGFADSQSQGQYVFTDTGVVDEGEGDGENVNQPIDIPNGGIAQVI